MYIFCYYFYINDNYKFLRNVLKCNYIKENAEVKMYLQAKKSHEYLCETISGCL